MKLCIPQIPTQERGKIFTDKFYVYYNFFYSSKYGGLNLKHEDFNERHIFMNELLKEIYFLHSRVIIEKIQIESYSFQHGHYKLLFLIENIIYWIRKNIDEMISLNYYADYFTNHGYEPDKLEISNIGTLIKKQKHDLHSEFRSHLSKLDRINEVSNTYKHSFINSEAHNLIGKDEPVVNCLDLHHNNTANGLVWHSYFLREIVDDYVSFLNFSRDKLLKFKIPDTNSDKGATDEGNVNI